MSQFELYVKKLFPQFKYRKLNRLFPKTKRLSILDVGCGSRSNQIVRFSLNVKRYDGVDNQYWNNDLESYKSIDNFFKIDLEKDSLKKIENNLYDVILLSHVIEHLDNGEEVIRSLIKKLNVGGVIYIETPSPKTLNLPSGTGFSNFYDDPTHKRVYFNEQIIGVLHDRGLKILGFGIRRDLYRIILFTVPLLLFNVLYFIPVYRKLYVKGLWDTLGVAQFWLARRVK